MLAAGRGPGQRREGAGSPGGAREQPGPWLPEPPLVNVGPWGKSPRARSGRVYEVAIGPRRWARGAGGGSLFAPPPAGGARASPRLVSTARALAVRSLCATPAAGASSTQSSRTSGCTTPAAGGAEGALAPPLALRRPFGSAACGRHWEQQTHDKEDDPDARLSNASTAAPARRGSPTSSLPSIRAASPDHCILEVPLVLEVAEQLVVDEDLGCISHQAVEQLVDHVIAQLPTPSQAGTTSGGAVVHPPSSSRRHSSGQSAAWPPAAGHGDSTQTSAASPGDSSSHPIAAQPSAPSRRGSAPSARHLAAACAAAALQLPAPRGRAEASGQAAPAPQGAAAARPPARGGPAAPQAGRAQLPARRSGAAAEPAAAPPPTPSRAGPAARARRPVPRAGPQSARAARCSLLDEVTYVGGRKRERADVTSACLRGLAEDLRRSMLDSFQPAVWDACEVRHPASARKRRGEAEAPEQAGRASARATIRACAQADKAARERGEAMMSLARQSGMTLLDVEEAEEVFLRYVAEGGLDISKHNFAGLTRHLLRDAQTSEIRHVLHAMKKARRRRGGSPGRLRRESATGFVSEEERLPDTFTFSDFFLGFSRWLQKHEGRFVNRCTLCRYRLGLVDKFKADLAGASGPEVKQMVDELAKALAAGSSAQDASELQAEALFGTYLKLEDLVDQGCPCSSGTSSSGSSRCASPQPPPHGRSERGGRQAGRAPLPRHPAGRAAAAAARWNESRLTVGRVSATISEADEEDEGAPRPPPEEDGDRSSAGACSGGFSDVGSLDGLSDGGSEAEDAEALSGDEEAARRRAAEEAACSG